MKAPDCISCGKPVLELPGQFTLLDSFYLNGDSFPPVESAGHWHLQCLTQTTFGKPWQQLRLKNFVEVRGYKQLSMPGEWIVLQHPRTKEPMALSSAGGLLSLAFNRGPKFPAKEGFIYEVEQDEYHLELEDPEIIRAIQTSLTSTKTFPIPALCELLGIVERATHPESLERGLLHYNSRLQQYWTKTSVSSRWSYGVFVPLELEPYVIRKG